MATNIKSTQLDFATIKTSLKTHLSQQTEFADYNFEASGLSNILDVLAHNTHFNGLVANFALNESFLNTAQLRSSVVSHAETLGYNPKSITSATAHVALSTTITAVGRPATITLPKYSTFTTSVDDISYTFYTLEAHTATDDGTGNYSFLSALGTTAIPLVEGTLKTKTFYVGSATDRQIYVIPETSIDTKTVAINVFTSSASSDFIVYSELHKAITVDTSSRLFQLRESPNAFYELSFSDGITTGLAPVAGNKIVVSYLSSKGALSNGGATYTPTNTITVDGTAYTIVSTTSTVASGGADKETIESIRSNAPIAFSAQNRLVTADDYKALILSKYPAVSDCIAWGGEDNLPTPEYGKVFVSLKFPDTTSAASKVATQDEIITNLIKPLAIMTIDTKFVDPVITFLETSTLFNFNPNKTNVTLKSAETNVATIVSNYFTTNLNAFGKTFRRSNLLTEIDNIGDSILNSKIDLKLQRRFVPTLATSKAYDVTFPVQLAVPDDVHYIVSSNTFTFNSKLCTIRNLLSSTQLQVVDADGGIQISNVGTYNATTGVISITGFAPVSISGGVDYIRISVTPANQGTVTPLRNYVLNIDTTRSFTAGTVDYGKTQVAL
tara:strand:- start:10325 stop:12160 length:1836 start_codon:yes stop_codon:yes gene_type:complete